jgi:hypothetical protein
MRPQWQGSFRPIHFKTHNDLGEEPLQKARGTNEIVEVRHVAAAEIDHHHATARNCG